MMFEPPNAESKARQISRKRVTAVLIFAISYLAVEVFEMHSWIGTDWYQDFSGVPGLRLDPSSDSGRHLREGVGQMKKSLDDRPGPKFMSMDMEFKSMTQSDKDVGSSNVVSFSENYEGGITKPDLEENNMDNEPDNQVATNGVSTLSIPGVDMSLVRSSNALNKNVDAINTNQNPESQKTEASKNDVEFGLDALEKAMAELTKKMSSIEQTSDEQPNEQPDAAKNITKSLVPEQFAYPEPLEICGRPAPLHLKLKDIVFGWRQSIIGSGTPKPKKKMLLLESHTPYGRTGNMILAFLHAFDYARDHDMDIGMRKNCWAMDAILEMWMENNEDKVYDWMVRVEEALDIKIIRTDSQLARYEEVKSMGAKDLFQYKTPKSVDETKPFHMHIILTLFRFYNTGTGVDHRKNNVKDVCTGIHDVFGKDPADVKYSVIHSRNLEGRGYEKLQRLSRGTFCDPKAAIDMEPEYIKSILKPIGMLNRPIVFITDGEASEVLDRLKADPEIGPQLRLVSRDASWVGGDITLAIMSNVFIGNPASTMSGFINRARDSLGFEMNYLFLKKNESGEWIKSCDRNCIWDKRIMMSMA